MRRPRVALFALGGTISGAADQHGRSAPTLTAEALVAAVPQIGDVVEFEVGRTMQVGSHELTPAVMCRLAHDIRRSVECGVEAVVVAQGTDTLEETAYALSLQLDLTVPVVLTGAMRPPIAAGPDGPANLLAAVRAATVPALAPFGPVVVIQDEIHHARWVTKLHTARIAAFGSPGHGPIGSVAEGRVRVDAAPVASDFVGLPDQLDRRVEVVWTVAGGDGGLVDAARVCSDGVVIAAMGGGHVPPSMVPALERAAVAGTPVVLASRCLAGPVLTRTYSGRGTETELLKLGVIAAGELSAVKARLRLLVALALELEPATVFDNGGDELIAAPAVSPRDTKGE